MKKVLNAKAGFTLIEVLVSLLILGIITAAMFRVYVNQHHAWMIQDSVIEMQQNARAGIDELTRQLRMAGYALPNGLDPLGAFDNNPDTIIVYYKSNLDCDAPIQKAMPQPSAELDCKGEDVSCFSAGQFVYIYDPDIEQGEFFEISFVQTTPAKIQHNKWPLSRSYPLGSVIMALEQVKFYIDQSDTLHPQLMIQVGNAAAQPYADDIVDLQFDYTLKNGAVLTQPLLVKDVRQIGISLTSRTPTPDVEFPDNPYRFKTYQSRVFLRNM